MKQSSKRGIICDLVKTLFSNQKVKGTRAVFSIPYLFWVYLAPQLEVINIQPPSLKSIARIFLPTFFIFFLRGLDLSGVTTTLLGGEICLCRTKKAYCQNFGLQRAWLVAELSILSLVILKFYSYSFCGDSFGEELFLSPNAANCVDRVRPPSGRWNLFCSFPWHSWNWVDLDMVELYY